MKKTITKTTRTVTTIRIVNGRRIEESRSTTTVEEAGDRFDDSTFPEWPDWSDFPQPWRGIWEEMFPKGRRQ